MYDFKGTLEALNYRPFWEQDREEQGFEGSYDEWVTAKDMPPLAVVFEEAAFTHNGHDIYMVRVPQALVERHNLKEDMVISGTCRVTDLDNGGYSCRAVSIIHPAELRLFSSAAGRRYAWRQHR